MAGIGGVLHLPVAGIGGVLHLIIGEPGGAAHQPAAEAVRPQGAAGIDPHLDEQAAARLARP